MKNVLAYEHLPFQISTHLGCPNIRLYGDGYGIVDEPGYGTCEEYKNITSLCDLIHYALCSCAVKLDRESFRTLLSSSDCNLAGLKARLLGIGIDHTVGEMRDWLNGVSEIPSASIAHIKFVLAPLRIYNTLGFVHDVDPLYARANRPAPEFFDIGYDSMSTGWVWLNEPQDETNTINKGIANA